MEKINFNSKDGLLITADYYQIKNPKGLILLCHRSHSNRAEYRETAPKFNKLGYSCLAIDQRSGMKVFGESNETKDRAKAKGLPTGYLDAKPDIESAIDFAFKLNENNKIHLFGSSYSAALSLLITSESSEKLKSTITFSPGEYLKGITLADRLSSVNIPIFATSKLDEIEQVEEVTENIKKEFITHFKPKVEGFHGSKALWEVVKGYETYWESLKEFLEKN